MGAAAYKERIDCLRSGLDGTAGPDGVEAELDGLPEVADGEPPKKSRPSNESAALTCLGGAGAFGGAARPGTSVVLGLAGGSGTSPKRSTEGAAFGAGATGWLDVDEARRDAPRSNWAFSLTRLRG